MRNDNITEIGIDDKNRLYVKPETENFIGIYRIAKEVGWDIPEKYLHTPSNLKRWSLIEWYSHIISTVEKDANCILHINNFTMYKNLEEELIQKIKDIHNRL